MFGSNLYGNEKWLETNAKIKELQNKCLELKEKTIAIDKFVQRENQLNLKHMELIYTHQDLESSQDEKITELSKELEELKKEKSKDKEKNKKYDEGVYTETQQVLEKKIIQEVKVAEKQAKEVEKEWKVAEKQLDEAQKVYLKDLQENVKAMAATLDSKDYKDPEGTFNTFNSNLKQIVGLLESMKNRPAEGFAGFEKDNQIAFQILHDLLQVLNLEQILDEVAKRQEETKYSYKNFHSGLSVSDTQTLLRNSEAVSELEKINSVIQFLRTVNLERLKDFEDQTGPLYVLIKFTMDRMCQISEARLKQAKDKQKQEISFLKLDGSPPNPSDWKKEKKETPFLKQLREIYKGLQANIEGLNAKKPKEKQKLEDQKKEKAIIDDISLAAEMLEDLKEYIKNECLLDEDESESEDEREVNPHFPLDEEYMKELIYNEAALIKNKIDTFKDFEVTDKGKSAKSFLLFEPGAIMGRFSPLIAKNRSNVKKNLEDLMKLCELPMHAEKNRKSTISKSSRG